MRLENLRIKIFADGADLDSMRRMHQKPWIRGFTTNPTLMRKAGVENYEQFARQAVAAIPDRPISFEVLADNFDEMERQAHKIAAWGPNVYAKIPVTNSRRESTAPLLKRLAAQGVKVNVTALLTLDQVRTVAAALEGGAESCISIFAGRIADTGIDPLAIMCQALEIVRPHRHIELMWASPRELLNIFQADALGCHIITVTSDILAKLGTIGKDLDDFSFETVEMFYRDAAAAGFML